MFKLLINYIREQKTSLVQVFGLGLVIIIMASSFLGLNFATNYINDQYFRDIARGEFHQEVEFYPEAGFKKGSIRDSWLDNINYAEQYRQQNWIDKEKMLKATFQIRKLPEYDETKNLYLYRFYFESNDDNVHVGERFAQKTNHNFIDFKLSIPFNYPSIEKHNQFVNLQADIINSYVYDPNDSKTSDNQTNFFITNDKALSFYDKEIKDKYPYAKRNYQKEDIAFQGKVYQYLIMGMLYGDNLSWSRVYTINDLLITGKTLSFIQTSEKDKVNAPIIVDDTNKNIAWKNLKNNEILIYREFAKENNLRIGQNYIFAGYKFHIVGFATSALAANNANYFYGKSNNKNQTVAFTNQATIEKISSNPYADLYESFFQAFNPEVGSKNISEKIDNQWAYQYFHQKLINHKILDKTKLYSAINNAVQNMLLLNPLNIANSYKIQAIEAVVWTNINELKDIFIEIAVIFLGLIFIVVSVIVFIVIFKMIDRNKRLIGILKAHGYPKWKLNVSLVISTIFPILLFAVIGSVLGVIVGHFIVSTYSTAIILITYGWPFYYQSALFVIFVPFIVLLIIAFVMVAFLLKVNALTLINNSWTVNKYNAKINVWYSSLVANITKSFNYYNKLAVTTTLRSFGKMFFIIIVSIFASTLLLFSFSSVALVNNLLGLQFTSINYKYGAKYNFNNDIINNFVDDNNQLIYKKASVDEIRSKPSLYLTLRKEIIKILENPKDSRLVDFRYGYLMGSELYKIQKEIVEPNFDKFPVELQTFWKQNIYFIDYLTNYNGEKETDLMINFGLLPYNSKFENPYTQLNFSNAHDFNINTIDTNNYYYDNDTNILHGDWSKLQGNSRIVYSVSDSAGKYLSPGFKNTTFSDFSNLTLEEMDKVGGWLNNNFLDIRNLIIKKFNIENPDTAAVKIIPMIGSTITETENIIGGDGNNLGKTVLYCYKGFDKQTKYVIGVIYDGARNLLQNTILMPEKWLNQALFGSYFNLAESFANSKFTNFANSELYQYLPIISAKNDYWIDLSKISDSDYFQEKGIMPGLELIYDVDAIKDIFKARQYSLQTLIILFGFFSMILSFMIIIIISNINIRDNLVLINILQSLGYTTIEISYIFLIVLIPILIVFSLFSIFIAPMLTGVIAAIISEFLLLSVPIIFEWWYFALTLFTVLLIYFISYIITWSLNVKNKKLTNLIK
ncbi:MAG: ABC transporter permease [Spiroplasma sp.]